MLSRVARKRHPLKAVEAGTVARSFQRADLSKLWPLMQSLGTQPLKCKQSSIAMLGKAGILPALLRFNVASGSCLGHRTDGGAKIRLAPKGRQARPQVRKILPQNSRRVRLELANKFGRRPTKVGLDKQMHAIRPHFERVDLHVTQRCRFVNQLSKALFDAICQYRTAVLWTPDDVVFETENSPGILGVVCVRVTRAGLYTRDAHNEQEDGASPLGFR
jgi:hypothetical protein